MNGKDDRLFNVNNQNILTVKGNVDNYSLTCDGCELKKVRKNAYLIDLKNSTGRFIRISTTCDLNGQRVLLGHINFELSRISEPSLKSNTALKYDAEIEKKGSWISWSHILITADTLNIYFRSELDGEILKMDDVTNQSSYEFRFQNKKYDRTKIFITIEGYWKDGSGIVYAPFEFLYNYDQY